MGRNKQDSCKICFKSMRSDNLKRHMKVHMNRNLDDKPVKKRKFNEIYDVNEPEDENEIELEDENEIEPESEKELESEDEMVIEPEDEKEIVLQIQNNEQDSNCSETLHYCTLCDYATKRTFNMEGHMKIKHTHTQEDLDLCLNKSTEYAPTEYIDEAIEV